MVNNGLYFRGGVQRRTLQVSNRFIQQIGIIRFLSRGEDQAGIRRRILGLVSPHTFKIAGISDDLGELFQLIQLRDFFQGGGTHIKKTERLLQQQINYFLQDG